MRSRGTSLTMALVASSALVAVDARAQSSAACVNDAPNPYKLATNWAQLPRPFGPTNAVAVDAKDNVWVLDRCGDEGCSGSSLSPIIELSPGGQTLKNFGAGTFVNGHGIAVDKDGNVWGVDFQTRTATPARPTFSVSSPEPAATIPLRTETMLMLFA